VRRARGPPGRAARPLPRLGGRAPRPPPSPRARTAAVRGQHVRGPRRARPPSARGLRRSVSDPNEFRREVRAALNARLTLRRADDVWTVLGAGSDDVEAGRADLRALSHRRWAPPAWPGGDRGPRASPPPA